MSFKEVIAGAPDKVGETPTKFDNRLLLFLGEYYSVFYRWNSYQYINVLHLKKPHYMGRKNIREVRFQSALGTRYFKLVKRLFKNPMKRPQGTRDPGKFLV